MKLRILALLTVAGLLCGSAPLMAQAPPPYKSAIITYGAGTPPTFTCSAHERFYWNTSANVLWFCEGGTWISTIAAAGTSFPLLAPAGTINAPSYSFSTVPEMGLWRSGTSFVLQSKGTTVAAGRSRLTLGEDFFTLMATRTENSAHSGAFQCFDEGGSLARCRIDLVDALTTANIWQTNTITQQARSAGPYVVTTEVTAGNTQGWERHLTNTAGRTTWREDTTTNQQWLFLAGNSTDTEVGSIDMRVETPTRTMQLNIVASGYAGIGASQGDDSATMISDTSNANFPFTRIKAVDGSIEANVTTSVGSSAATANLYAYDGSGFATELEHTTNGTRIKSPNAKPTCDSTRRGFMYRVEGGAGVADTFEVCAKDAGDAYAWRALW
jgi:hypothetical protein